MLEKKSPPTQLLNTPLTITFWKKGKQFIGLIPLPDKKKRTAPIALFFNLQMKIWRNGDETMLTALCPLLSVTSCGKDEKEARKNIQEAVELFIETCFAMQTLDAVLEECRLKKERVELSEFSKGHELVDNSSKTNSIVSSFIPKIKTRLDKESIYARA